MSTTMMRHPGLLHQMLFPQISMRKSTRMRNKSDATARDQFIDICGDPSLDVTERAFVSGSPQCRQISLCVALVTTFKIFREHDVLDDILFDQFLQRQLFLTRMLTQCVYH